MAARNKGWKQGLFPIDERLIEQLIDDLCTQAGAEADAASCDDALDDDTESNSGLVWYLEVTHAGAESADEDFGLENGIGEDASPDVNAINMRVLNDYLRRRISDEPELITPTLH